MSYQGIYEALVKNGFNLETIPGKLLMLIMRGAKIAWALYLVLCVLGWFCMVRNGETL